MEFPLFTSSVSGTMVLMILQKIAVGFLKGKT